MGSVGRSCSPTRPTLTRYKPRLTRKKVIVLLWCYSFSWVRVNSRDNMVYPLTVCKWITVAVSITVFSPAVCEYAVNHSHSPAVCEYAVNHSYSPAVCEYAVNHSHSPSVWEYAVNQSLHTGCLQIRRQSQHTLRLLANNSRRQHSISCCCL